MEQKHKKKRISSQSDSRDVSSERMERNRASGSEWNFTEKTWREDVTFCVENKKLHVSKAILALVSPVFSSMFESDFAEKSQSEITLHGKNYEDVVEFLLCVYPNTMKPVNRETVFRVLPLADEYQVDILLAKCENFLLKITQGSNKPSSEDLCVFLNHAYMYHLQTLEESCISALSTVEFDEFQAAEVENPIVCSEAKGKIQTMMLTKMSGEMKSLEDIVTKSSGTIKRLEEEMTLKSNVIRQFDERSAFLSADGEKSPEGEIQLQLDNISLEMFLTHTSEEVRIRDERFKLKACYEPASIHGPASLGVYLCTLFKSSNRIDRIDQDTILQADVRVMFKLSRIRRGRSCGFYTKTKEWPFRLQCHALQYNKYEDKHGLKNFILWSEFINPASGFVQNGKALLSAYVAVRHPVSRYT